jgi:hypothetical protein
LKPLTIGVAREVFPQRFFVRPIHLDLEDEKMYFFHQLMLRMCIYEYCLANYWMAFQELYLRERERRRRIAIITILKQEREKCFYMVFTLLLKTG